jgi:DAK2 domain fusion protein YloV
MPFDLRFQHDRTWRDAVLDRTMRLFLESLEIHRLELDSLNVFPVPDADTGSNLWLTQRGVVDALDAAALDAARPGEGGPHDDSATEVISAAVLRSARGNSGVIVAQIVRALMEDVEWAEDGPGAGPALAAALARAVVHAMAAVAEPLDGTILSVLAEAAARARASAGQGAESAAPGGAITPGRGVAAGKVAAAALAGGRVALARTVDVLPALRAAGVVDAGGLGLVLLLDALHAAVTGGSLTQTVGPLGPLDRRGNGSKRPEGSGPSLPAYEVQFVLRAADALVPELRARLGALGDSLVVVGGGGTHAVHVHTDHPEDALSAGRSAGAVEQASVLPLGDHSVTPTLSRRTALVAVADGDGVVAAFESLGAIVVRADLARSSGAGVFIGAIEGAASGVVLLPNDPELAPAAANAIGQTGGRVAVVETTSMLEGLVAAAAHNPELDPVADAAAMRSAADAVVSGTLSQAGTAGQWVAALGGRSVAAADAAVPAAEALVERLVARVPDPEIVTVIVGAAGDDGVVNAIRAARPDLRVDVIHGGQLGSAFLIGVE